MIALLADGVVVAILLGGVLTAAAGLRRRSAAERHWLLAVAIAAALAVPALRLVAPARLAGGIEFGSLAGLARDAQQARVDAAPTTAPASPIFTTNLTIASGPSTPAPRWPLGPLAVWIWVTGVVVALGRLLLALVRLRVLAAGAATVETGPWRARCDELCTALGVRAPVRILHSPHPSLLATWGWRRPIVMLPRDALGWAPERVHVVLAHELAHVARGDWRHQLAAETLRALHWCNPLVWLACRRLRLESERASDDTVLALGVDGPTFAAHLVDLARRLRPAGIPWLPAPAMVRRSSLEGRVRAMLDQSIARRPASIRARCLLAAAVVAAALPLAAFGAAAQFFTVRGSLSDPSGRALPGATVVLVNPTTASRHEVRSDATGRFELVGLPPATYRLEARTLGFRTYSEELIVAGDVDRPLQLAVGTLQETITVIGDGQPDAPPDAAALARRAEGRRRASERQQRALATCAAGPPAPVGGNILPPVKVVDVRPAYPEHLRPAGVAGTVTMTATIDRTGAVSELRDLSGPHPDLEAAAAEAIRQWEFTATLLNCQPIEVEMRVTVRFSAAP